MDKRAILSIALVILFVLSGCIGAITGSNDATSEEQIDNPPTISMNEVIDADWGSAVQIAGMIEDENPATVRVTITVSIPWGTMHINPNEDGTWGLPFPGLEPGNYSVEVYATDESDQISPTMYDNFSVIPPAEADLVLTVWRDEVWYEEGENVRITGMVEHAFLDTCSVTWSSEEFESSTEGVLLDFSSGTFVIDLGQIEGEVIVTVFTSCGKYANSEAETIVSVQPIIEPDADSDGDGVPDEVDDCDDGDSFSSSPITDHDADGCYDITEDLDDDNDGVGDTLDNCPKGQTGWWSSPTNDHDGDGCLDATEDDDDDGDGISDSTDSCPGSPWGWRSNLVSDYDSDGCRDSDEDDDDDNDGFADWIDSCPNGVVGWIPDMSNDKDSDGCRDSDEDEDDDNDSVPDANDTCPETMTFVNVDENGCADYQKDTDGDGLTDDLDECEGTPMGVVVNEQGCADLDGDGVFANVDVCPNSTPRWTADGVGCTVIQNPVTWKSGPYSSNPMGTVGPMSIVTTTGTWQIQNEWDGNSTYLFIFNYKSSSYMASLWSQNVGTLLDNIPEETTVFFGSFDSDYANDIAAMESRVNNWLSGQPEEVQDSWNGRILYVNERAWDTSGSINSVINDWSAFYYGIDRFQRWREIGSLFDWSQGSSCCYRLDYIANEPIMYAKEFEVEMRRFDPAITVVDVFTSDRHSGGWSSGYTTKTSAVLPNASVMAQFNTLEVFLEHSCSEHKDRYGIDDDGDGTADRYGGCHEWDYLHYL